LLKNGVHSYATTLHCFECARPFRRRY
jgi:hypothetical protein